jgi:UDP-GlcNAc3NAcA epimerase
LKILTIVGARPQFIKAYPVSKAISEKKDIEEVLLHTGQHYDFNMSKIFFSQLSLKEPDYNLGVGSGTHGKQTGEMLKGIEDVILKESPNLILIYGDTNSTLAGALSGAKCQIPVAHVEAGLRSYNMRMPEEINRILADRISSYLFCPTETAVNNLIKEGFSNFNYEGFIFKKPKVINSGDVMYDAFLLCKEALNPAPEIKKITEDHDKFYLATIHRAENTDSKNNLKNIIDALEEISKDAPVILPIHPRTKAKLINHNIVTNKLKLIEPVGYFDMLYLLDKCQAVLTDSGGLQKEAYFSGKPCITLREETEWTELIGIGANTLVGPKKDKIIESVRNTNMVNIKVKNGIYGNGNASNGIVDLLSKDLSERENSA